jgi:small GTP-binding protein
MSRDPPSVGASAGPTQKTWRVLILGDASVGKTCILRHFRGDADPTKDTLATVGIDMVRSDVQIGKKTVKLQIWDTAGQEKCVTEIIWGMYRIVAPIP